MVPYWPSPILVFINLVRLSFSCVLVEPAKSKYFVCIVLLYQLLELQCLPLGLVRLFLLPLGICELDLLWTPLGFLHGY